MPCGDTTTVLPTPALSHLQPGLLLTSTVRTSGWDYSDALQFATEPANIALCSFTTAGRKEKSHCCLGLQRDASALKDSLNHCWYHVTPASLEKTLPFCFHTSRKSPSCSQIKPVLHGDTYNLGRHYLQYSQLPRIVVFFSWHSLLSMMSM